MDHQFHPKHGDALMLSGENTQSEWRDGESSTLFSGDPLRPGVKFTVRVTDHGMIGAMIIGLTQTDPSLWDGQTGPRRMRATWCLFTHNGEVQLDGRDAGSCDRWRDNFGGSLDLLDGDTCSVELCPDRSVSLCFNNTEVTHAFTDLPRKPTWVVIYQWVNKVEIIQPVTVTVAPVQRPAPRGRTPVTIRSRPISLEQFDTFTIKPARREHFELEIRQLMQTGQAYVTNKARKGKVCIISNAVFLPPWLKPLPGYDVDKQRLSELWYQMGFDVFLPQASTDPDSFTVLEMRNAIHEYQQLLCDDDQMAVICVLSHGDDGSIYGSDGNTMPVNDIIETLDNNHCIQMAGKPKLLVIQTCQGDTFDEAVVVRSRVQAAAGAQSYELPSKSDFIICYPNMPGNVSFVDSSLGSIYIQKFVDVMKEKAGSKGILDIITEINAKVSQTVVSYPHRGVTNHRMMPYLKSCLTKSLHILPCPGGTVGEDWRL